MNVCISLRACTCFVIAARNIILGHKRIRGIKINEMNTNLH